MQGSFMFPEAVLSLDRIGVLMMFLAADTNHNTPPLSPHDNTFSNLFKQFLKSYVLGNSPVPQS